MPEPSTPSLTRARFAQNVAVEHIADHGLGAQGVHLLGLVR